MSAKKISPPVASELTRAVWLRAIITAIFACFTIFWQDDTLNVSRIAVAAYLVLHATTLWDYIKAEPVPAALRGPLALGTALAVVSGIAALFVPSPMWLALVAAVGIGGVGVTELMGGIKTRQDFVPAKDHMIIGVFGIATSIGLIAGVQLDPHGIMGMAGTGVIVMAVLLLISAAGLTHEARKANSS